MNDFELYGLLLEWGCDPNKENLNNLKNQLLLEDSEDGGDDEPVKINDEDARQHNVNKRKKRNQVLKTIGKVAAGAILSAAIGAAAGKGVQAAAEKSVSDNTAKLDDITKTINGETPATTAEAPETTSTDKLSDDAKDAAEAINTWKKNKATANAKEPPSLKDQANDAMAKIDKNEKLAKKSTIGYGAAIGGGTGAAVGTAIAIGKNKKIIKDIDVDESLILKKLGKVPDGAKDGDKKVVEYTDKNGKTHKLTYKVYEYGTPTKPRYKWKREVA